MTWARTPFNIRERSPINYRLILFRIEFQLLHLIADPQFNYPHWCKRKFVGVYLCKPDRWGMSTWRTEIFGMLNRLI